MLDEIIHGDSFELIKKIPDNSVNLVVTSPPYFQQRTYSDSSKEIGNEKSSEIYLDKLLVMFSECLRTLKEDGSIVWNLGDKYLDGHLQLLPYRFAIAASNHAKLINNIIWSKPNPTPRQYQRRLVNSHEPFFHFAKSDSYYYSLPNEKPARPARELKESRYFEMIENSCLTKEQKEKAVADLYLVMSEVGSGKLHSFRMKIKGMHSMPFGGQEGGRKNQILNNGYTVIRIYGKKIQKDLFECPVESIKWKKHPAIYPQAIVEKFLSMLSKENDVVLDPFSGSGTTAVACKKMNRRYLGFELCQDFVEESKKRLS